MNPDSNNKTPVRIMLDLETMSLEDNAAIIQIGACTFMTPKDQAKFVCYIDPKSSEEAGCHVSKETMEWWNKQNTQLRTLVFSGTTPIQDALASFSGWVFQQCEGDYSRLKLYANGPEFDWVILKNAFYKVLGTWPFPHRAAQSTRSLWDVADMLELMVVKTANCAQHNALADALAQANDMENIMYMLRSRNANGN